MDELEKYPAYVRVAFSQEPANTELFRKNSFALACLSIVLMITATFGNGMIIVAILRSQNLQTPSYLLITSLAFTDLLVGLVYHPLLANIAVCYLRKDVTALYFSMEAFICVSSILALISLIMMAYISIDRYLALRLKHRYRIVVTKKRVRLVIVVAWALTLLPLILNAFRRLLDTAFYATASSIYFLCLSITCVFYAKLFKTLHLYTMQVQAQQPNPLVGNFDVVRYKKTLKTMIIVLGCYLLCCVPVTCAMSAMTALQLTKETALLQTTAAVVYGLNSSINPVIYVIRFPDIRSACREMLRIGN